MRARRVGGRLEKLVGTPVRVGDQRCGVTGITLLQARRRLSLVFLLRAPKFLNCGRYTLDLRRRCRARNKAPARYRAHELVAGREPIQR